MIRQARLPKRTPEAGPPLPAQAHSGMPAQQRLAELAAGRGVSLAALSTMLGRNPSYLQQFIRKGSPRKLEEDDRRRLSEFFGVPEAELGAMHPGAGRASATGTRDVAPQDGWVDVPRLPLGASAGPGAFVQGEAPIGHLRFSRRWLARQGFDPAALSVITVEGDSMEPTLRDGDEILVDRSPRALSSGIHVLRRDDILLVKRIEPSGDRLRLISDNHAYPPIELPLGDVQVLGRVVWKGGRL